MLQTPMTYLQEDGEHGAKEPQHGWRDPWLSSQVSWRENLSSAYGLRDFRKFNDFSEPPFFHLKSGDGTPSSQGCED